MFSSNSNHYKSCGGYGGYCGGYCGGYGSNSKSIFMSIPNNNMIFCIIAVSISCIVGIIIGEMFFCNYRN